MNAAYKEDSVGEVSGRAAAEEMLLLTFVGASPRSGIVGGRCEPGAFGNNLIL